MKQQRISNANLPLKCTLTVPTVVQLVVKIPQKKSAKTIAGVGKNKDNSFRRGQIKRLNLQCY